MDGNSLTPQEIKLTDSNFKQWQQVKDKDLNARIEHKDNYYFINDNEFVLMLEQANQDIVDALLKNNPLKVIALDKLFNGNNQLKTNTAIQFKDAGIELRTI